MLDSNNLLDSLLLSNVDDLGNVNYKKIIENPFALNQYLDFIKAVSPESYPDYFKTENSKKAYWINAYNALILKIMIENPGEDILDISFFGHAIFLKKFKIGNTKISPSFIENKILRKMNDPRIHFAINCASKSCPPLGNRILIGEQLDRQLDNKASIFINNEDNVLIDHKNKIIYLNRIFKWFKKDFGNLSQYISKYLIEVNYESIKDYKIKFTKYDWTKNSLN
tara:strand:- start:547 stop:1221 length:675 start_codon:yes stop_codon:yes gene_type:complete